MDKQTKKRKNAESFSLKSLEKRFSAKQAFRDELSVNIAFLRGIEISRMEQVEEEEALIILSSKITFQGVLFLKTAIHHVPKTFVMKCSDYGGASLCSVLIYEMVSASQTSLSSLSKQEVDCYVNFLESSCPNFIASNPLPDEQLWKMSEVGKYCFTKFLAPLVTRCLRCDGNITMHNPPSKASLYPARPNSGDQNYARVQAMQDVVRNSSIHKRLWFSLLPQGTITGFDRGFKHHLREWTALQVVTFTEVRS